MVDPRFRIFSEQPHDLHAGVKVVGVGAVDQVDRLLEVARHQFAFEGELPEHPFCHPAIGRAFQQRQRALGIGRAASPAISISASGTMAPPGSGRRDSSSSVRARTGSSLRIASANSVLAPY